MLDTTLDFNWRWLSENSGSEAFAEIAVVKFVGDCRPGLGPVSSLAPFGEVITLGRTQVSAGRVFPVSQIECEQVKRSLGHRSNDGSLGRALGKVLAHELYHALGRTTSHTLKGLAKALYSPFDLISKERPVLELGLKGGKPVDSLRAP